MLATYLEGILSYVLHILAIKGFDALKWRYISSNFFLWKKIDAAMSKLSFRARALDANKSLPVYHAEDVPDLPDIASVNRVVPQMPTGMEKEEETVSIYKLFFQFDYKKILKLFWTRSSSEAPKINYASDIA